MLTILGPRTRSYSTSNSAPIKMSAGFLRLHEQIRAVWKARDKEQPFVCGMLLNGAGNECKVLERWFTVIGHALFYSMSRHSPEYSGVFFTDIFNPVVARVDDRTMNAFNLDDKEACTFALHLKGVMVSDLEVLLFPESAEEKKQWLEKLQGDAGLIVHTRQNSDKQRRGTDGREKVVVISGTIDDSLYLQRLSPGEPRVKSASQHWREEWKRIAHLALSLPDAFEVSKRTKVLEKLVMSEGKYVYELSTLVNLYYRVFKTAITSGHLVMQYDQLDAIFLNSESLLLFHHLLLDHMRQALSKPSPLFGGLFNLFVPQMNIYLEFIKNHEKSLQALDECLTNPSLTTFLENHHFSHDCEAQQLKQLLYSPVTRLEIYWASLEEILKHTCRSHIDYKPLTSALEALKRLKQTLSQRTSQLEHQEKMLSILEGVGTQGFLLMQPDCSLVLEGTLHLPPSAKWMSGSLRRRPVHCYLYTNALVVLSNDKKVKNQVFPLSGATVYPYVTTFGEVTHARDPELDVKALKVYSPNGPRNGIILSFSTQSTKGLWVVRISELIRGHSPETDSSRTISPQLPLRRYNSVLNVTETKPLQQLDLVKPPPVPPRPNSLLTPPVGRRRSSTVTEVSLLRPVSRTSSLLSLDAENGPTPTVPPRTQYYSIPTLFSKLTNPPDPYYPATFLLTYRMFTNAHEVLDALIEAHRKDLDSRKSNGKRHDIISTLSLRFFNTLKMWVNKYYVDFHHDVTLKRVLMVYMNTIKEHKRIHEKECDLAEAVLNIVSQRGHIPLTRKSKLKIRVHVPCSVRSASFDELSAETVATQLTWLEHEAYARIKPYEFLQQKWTKKNKQELAPNICYVISHFNQMTLWITKEILGQDAAKHRCAVIQKMLQIADHCLKLRNYVTVFQITSALSSTPIQRLKKTWDLVPQTMIEQLTELKKLTSLEGGSKVYREMQKSSPSPSVPYIGPYLNQLICIEVGMPTFVKQPPEHINYSKLVKLGAVIEEVTRFQNPKYSLVADGAVLTYLDNALESAESFDDEQRYSRSIEVEPRKGSSKAKSPTGSTKVKPPLGGSKKGSPLLQRRSRSKSPQPSRERSKSPQPNARLMSFTKILDY